MRASPCIAIVSPFLDKRHGTERCVAEQAEGLARSYGFEVHLYAQRVEDLAGVVTASEYRRRKALHRNPETRGGVLVWHRVPNLPGPQIVKYAWWFLANRFYRWLHQQRGLSFDLVYTPGVNCFDADLISVHIVFAEFVRQVREELLFGRNALRFWPRLAHRKLYYSLLIALERWVYGNPATRLVVVSRKVAEDLKSFYPRNDAPSLVYHGLDFERFNARRRAELRPASRRALELPESSCVVLLVGNDFRKKGLRCLLEAAAKIPSADLRVLVVGEDDPSPYQPLIEANALQGKVRFAPIRSDVEFYYAAADLYAGPSLEDAFALPPFEAMACGVPAIVSRRAGVSELVTHGTDGFVLEDPMDAETLTGWIRQLLNDPSLRCRMGERAARNVARYTWERNVAEMKELIVQVIAARQPGAALEHAS